MANSQKFLETLLSNIILKVLDLFAGLILILYKCYQNVAGKFLLAHMTGVTVVLLCLSTTFLLILLGTIIYTYHLRKIISELRGTIVDLQEIINNPFSKYPLDPLTNTCRAPNENIHYCPSCLGNHKYFQVILKPDNSWICTNTACKNSKPKAWTSGIQPKDSPDVPKNPRHTDSPFPQRYGKR